MKHFLIVLSGLLVLGCGGKDSPPEPPEAALLTFPLQNSECTTGVDLNATTSQVEFKWQTAMHAKTYELRVTNLVSNTTQTVSTQAISAKLPLEKGAPYSWVVISRNSETQQTATSATWQFYNAGSQTTYAPFPARIIVPLSGASVIKDINNEVVLEWSGADVDNDILGYEVYFDTETPPGNLIASPAVNITNIKVSVTSDTVYYWKVITKDGEGNTSDSGIFSFKAL